MFLVNSKGGPQKHGTWFLGRKKCGMWNSTMVVCTPLTLRLVPVHSCTHTRHLHNDTDYDDSWGAGVFAARPKWLLNHSLASNYHCYLLLIESIDAKWTPTEQWTALIGPMWPDRNSYLQHYVIYYSQHTVRVWHWKWVISFALPPWFCIITQST